MKKIIASIIAFPLILAACSESDDLQLDPPREGTGHIIINTTTESEITRATPIDDFSSYYVILDDGDNIQQFDYPSGGIVRNIETGFYDMTVTSHIRPKLPAFDLQHYSGTTKVTVSSGERAQASVHLTMLNAGVVFEYDEELEELGWNIIPTLTTLDGSLEYSGENRHKPGYFEPEEVTLTVTDNGTPITIVDEESQKFTIKAGQLWKIRLHPMPSKFGGASFTVGFSEPELVELDEYTISEMTDPIILTDVELAFFRYEYPDSYNYGADFSQMKLRLSNASDVGGKTYSVHIDPQIERVHIDNLVLNYVLPIGSYYKYPINYVPIGVNYPSDPYGAHWTVYDGDVRTNYFSNNGRVKMTTQGGITEIVITMFESYNSINNVTFKYTGTIDWDYEGKTDPGPDVFVLSSNDERVVIDDDGMSAMVTIERIPSSVDIAVESNIQWSAEIISNTSDEDWFGFYTSSNDISMNTTANNDETPRTAVAAITARGIQIGTITYIQKGTKEEPEPGPGNMVQWPVPDPAPWGGATITNKGMVAVNGTKSSGGAATWNMVLTQIEGRLTGYWWDSDFVGYYLKFIGNELFWSEEVMGPEYSHIGVGVVEGDDGENIFIRNAPVKLLNDGAIQDFSFTYEGKEAAVGMVKINPATFEVIEIVGDFYYDLVRGDTGQTSTNLQTYNGIRYNSSTGKYDMTNPNYRMVDYK